MEGFPSSIPNCMKCWWRTIWMPHCRRMCRNWNCNRIYSQFTVSRSLTCLVKICWIGWLIGCPNSWGPVNKLDTSTSGASVQLLSHYGSIAIVIHLVYDAIPKLSPLLHLNYDSMTSVKTPLTSCSTPMQSRFLLEDAEHRFVQACWFTFNTLLWDQRHEIVGSIAFSTL